MNSPPSSNAFALPIAVSVVPAARIAAVIAALHCAPLPLLLTLPDAWPAAAVAAAAASLGWSLHRQRRATAAAKLLTVGDEWRLYRGDDGVGDAPGEPIELIDGARCGRFMLLSVAQHSRRFHLAVDSRAQPGEQTHRLRVWLAHRHGDAAVDSGGILNRHSGR